MTEQGPQQIDKGDHNVGIFFKTVTPDNIKALHLSTNRDAGVIIVEVLSNGPMDHAGFRVNDIIVAEDGVPIRRFEDHLAKVRMTPVGQSISITFERDGVVHEAPVTVERCLTLQAPRMPGYPAECTNWTQ